MPSSLTAAEDVLWKILRTPPLDRWQFRPKVEFETGIVADFVSQPARLVIETDRAPPGTVASARGRSAWFAARGYRTVNFSSSDILRNHQAVWMAISALLPEVGPGLPDPAAVTAAKAAAAGRR